MAGDLTQCLKCDVELALPRPKEETLNKWAADALRGAADLIESDGFNDATDKVGKRIDTIYVGDSEGGSF